MVLNGGPLFNFKQKVPHLSLSLWGKSAVCGQHAHSLSQLYTPFVSKISCFCGLQLGPGPLGEILGLCDFIAFISNNHSWYSSLLGIHGLPSVVYWWSQVIATMKITCWIHSLQCSTPSLGHCVGNLSGGSCEGGGVCMVGTCHAYNQSFLCVG